MYPVKIVRVLSEGALVQFSDGSTRQIMPEIINAWKRFGIDVAEGNLSREDIRLYNVAVKEFPHYSGIETADQPEIPWAAKNITEALEGAPEVVPEVIVDTPKVIEDVPDVSMVPEVTADSELRTGHFGQGWMPDFWHNAQVKWQQELERARNKNQDKTWMEILDEGPIEDIVTTPEKTAPLQVSVIDLADTKDLPNTIKVAQSIGSIFYKGKDGKKKLAVYKSQLEDFRNSVSYMKGRGSAIDQARKWMEAQIGAGTEVDFNALGGEPRFELGKDWDTVTDRLTLPDAGAAEVTVDLTKSDFEQERTAEALQAELDAIEKERAALNQDLELGTSPGWQAPMPISRVGEVTKGGVGDFGDYSVRAPRVTDFQTDVTDTRMPVATGIPYGVPSDMDEGMGSYRFAEAPGVTSLDEGMEEGYMYASPGEAAVAGLIPRMDDAQLPGGVGDFERTAWIDRLDPESRAWHLNQAREQRNRILTEKYGMDRPDEFGEIQKQAEQDAIEKAAFDRWMEDIQTNRYVAEKDLEGEYGPNRLEEVWTSEMMPTLEDAVVAEDKEYWLDKSDETPFLPFVGGDVQEFMYNGELWYLTKQGHYAKDYKRSELVTPWQTLPSDFF